jgi:phenylacetate-CoA ligase
MLSRVLWHFLLGTRSSRFSKNELERLQKRKFKRYNKYCYDNLPFYHESMAKAGLRPSTFGSLRDLKRLPILTKEEIARKSPGGFIAPRANVAYMR